MRPRLYRIICAVIVTCVVCFPQQRNTAGLYGRVTDQQGASIPGATVTLTQISTDIVRTAQSNSDGDWEFPGIPVGEYRLDIQKEGFSRVEQKGIVLQVNDNRRADISLPLGSVTSTVNVDAAALAVDVSGATLKGTVDSQRVVELPLNGRDLADLTFLVPGVQSASGATGGTGDGAKMAFAARRFSVDGSRQNNLSFTLDGGDNQDTLQNNNLPFPFPDAVQEFSVQTSNATAEFGKSLGGSVNIVTKSGTNSYHGDVFWFVRNTEFDANSFFSHTPDQLKQNQAGFTFGGPAIKDKLFFFGGYQQTWIRSLTGSGSAISIPANHRTGDFSDLLAGSKPIVLVNPSTGAPYPNNQIPMSQFSPAAQNLLKYAPVPGPDGLVHYAVPSLQNAREWITRVDYRINDKNSVYLRLYHNYTETPAEMVANNIFSSTQGIKATAEAGTIGDTYTLTPNLLVDTHFTANQYDGNRVYAFPGTMRTLGVNVNPSSNAIGVSLNGTSNISPSSGTPAVFARANLELTQNWQWIHGKHSMVWGADIETSRYNEYNTFNGEGVFNFNGQWTGFDQADFLIGQFSSFTQGNGEIEFKRLHYFGFYFGDTYRLNPRLTLSFGVRWEPYLPITDLNNRIVEFSPQAYSAGTGSQIFVNSPPGLLYPGDPHPGGGTVPKGVVQSQLDHFTPRFGVAYDLFGDGRTSVRAGYGMFYDSPELYAYNNINDQSPFSFTVNFLSGSFDNPYAGRTQYNVFPFAGDFQKNSAFQLPFAAAAVQSRQPLPYSQNWNATIEHQLRSSWLIRASYVGTKGTHLWGDYDANAPIYNPALTLTQNRQTIQQRRPRQVYQSLDLLFAGLNQSYNSLQVAVIKRLSYGLSNQLSYTLSKNLDYLSSNAQITSNSIQDPFNFFQFRGPSDFDRRNRFVDSFLYQVPDAGALMHSRLV
ncbi:MAG: TonB-dependent receptor, partial [Acidobacteriaceae bacterium]|nr:TonB-dependent receptor [Acidobacteriaceae bacterium]